MRRRRTAPRYGVLPFYEERRDERAGLYLFGLFALALPALIVGAFVLSTSNVIGDEDGNRDGMLESVELTEFPSSTEQVGNEPSAADVAAANTGSDGDAAAGVDADEAADTDLTETVDAADIGGANDAVANAEGSIEVAGAEFASADANGTALTPTTSASTSQNPTSATAAPTASSGASATGNAEPNPGPIAIRPVTSSPAQTNNRGEAAVAAASVPAAPTDRVVVVSPQTTVTPTTATPTTQTPASRTVVPDTQIAGPTQAPVITPTTAVTAPTPTTAVVAAPPATQAPAPQTTPPTTALEVEPAEFAQRIDIGRIGETSLALRFESTETTDYTVFVRTGGAVAATVRGVAVGGLLENVTVNGLASGTDYTVQAVLAGPPTATSPAVAFRTSGGGTPEPAVQAVSLVNPRVVDVQSTRFEVNYESNICANGSFVIREQGGAVVGSNAGQAAGCTTRHLSVPGFWTPALKPNTTYVITITVEANGAGQGGGNTATRSLTVTTAS